MKKVFSRAVKFLLCLSAVVIFVCGFKGIDAQAKTGFKGKTQTLTVGEKKKVKLYDGKKAVKYKKIKWSSKNKKIAKVSKKGEITAVAEGSTKIIAKYNGKKYTLKVTVNAKPADTEVKPAEPEITPVNPEPVIVHDNVPVDAGVYQGHAYKVYKGVVDWNTAKAACEKLGGHLATVGSALENAYISTLIGDERNKPGYWLGGYRDNDTSTEWKWVTGEPFTYTNWQCPEVNPGYENQELYLEMWNARLGYQWNDLGDHNYKNDWIQGYVCEWEYTR